MTGARYDAIVVLGARVYRGGGPSDALRYRVHTGARLYREGKAPLVVFTGGSPEPATTPTEAQVALRLALAEGVPLEVCLLEEESRTTWENAAFVAPLLRERSMARVRVVTDRYHLPRALRCFWAHGIAADGEPSRREDGSLFVPRRRATALVREAGALLQRPRLLTVKPPRPGS